MDKERIAEARKDIARMREAWDSEDEAYSPVDDFPGLLEIAERFSDALEAALARAEETSIPPWDTNLFAREYLKPGPYMEDNIRAMFYWAKVGYDHAVSRLDSLRASTESRP